jgi:hypothetical protein
MCVRDETQSFVLARTEWFSPVCNMDEAEACGLLSAIQWVRDLQLDYKQAVDSFQSSMEDVPSKR